MMEREALEFLQEQASEAATETIQTDDNGHTFLVGEDTREFVPDDMPETIQVTTLSSVVDFVKQSKDALSHGQLLVRVDGPRKVVVESTLDNYGRRARFLEARPVLDLMEFGHWYDREELTIALQAHFVSLAPEESREYDDKGTLLRFISAYQETDSNQVVDDGVSQTATVKTGAASVGTARVPNPVLLAPYRTFAEVEQPQSEFIFRMHEGMMGALFEADGGAWRSQAVASVKEYLNANLSRCGADVVVLG